MKKKKRISAQKKIDRLRKLAEELTGKKIHKNKVSYLQPINSFGKMKPGVE